MSFENLKLIKPIQTALINEGYTIPTPIQQQAIPVILERKDLLGSAQTGTGKTAAFAIPILQILSEEKEPARPNQTPRRFGKSFKYQRERKTIKALIITPTRELAVQVGESFSVYGKNTGIKNTVVYGGVSQYHQTDKLRQGVDILIATPGRLLDLINQKFIDLSQIKILVLDEADRMLDMGFIHDIKKIISLLPEKRQSLFFSATMPPEIVKLANTILTDPVKIEIASKTKTVEVVKQAVYFVSRPDKKNLLIHILKNENVESALVFTKTKKGADKVSKFLNDAKINSDAIHGNKSQHARQLALNNFKLSRTKVLVATDIAARGIDIEKLSHVFNFDMPDYSENYIHRIGRTGRAGLGGTALSFCDSEERYYLREINRLIKTPIPVIEDHPFKSSEPDNSGVEIPVKKFRSSRKPDAFRFSRDSKKRWVRKSGSIKKKRT
ncbi:MAG: DEAD/DEAH box helicase [Ignavibacteriales bacterium]|nr:MAG: DEAD/DEAH box helicase [Ignavibacteriales bacterium]